MRQFVIKNPPLLLLCLSVASAGLIGSPSRAEVTTAAWYRLGEAGAISESGGSGPALQPFGFVTTFSGTPSSQNTPLATSTLSQSFDGATGVLATQPGVLAIQQVDNVGMEAWVRSDNSAANAIIVHQGMSSPSLGSRGFGLLQINGNYAAHLAGLVVFGAAPVQVGVWTHLGLVNQDGIWQFYVNGVLNATAEMAQLPSVSGIDSLSIGASPSRGDSFFPGQVDEVRLFTLAPGQFYSGDLNYFSPSLPPWIKPYNWSTIAERSPGIRYTQVTVTNPRLNVVSVLQVDLANPDIRLSTTGRHPNWGQPMPTYSQYTVRTGRQTTRNFLTSVRSTGVNMVAAINAAPWLPWSELNFLNQNTFAFADQMGLAVANGVVVSDQTNSPFTSPSLVYGKDWTAQIVTNKSNLVNTSNVLTAVSGFDMVVTRGITSGTGAQDLNPRTAIGLSFDRKKLVLMTVDGRRNGYSLGVGTKEVGELLRHFGSWNGINMDGGGSTTMALYNAASNSVTIANRPSGTERINGNNLGVYYISSPEQVAFADWLRFRGVPDGNRGALDDPSGDGIPNLLAYLFNVHPLRGMALDDFNGRPSYTITTSQTGEHTLEMTFRVNRYATGISWVTETSQGLLGGTWTAASSTQIESLGLDPLTRDPLYRAKIPVAGADRIFGRIRAQLPAQ